MYLEYTDYLRIIGNPSVKEENFYAMEVYAEAVIDAFTFHVIGKKNLTSNQSLFDTIKKAMAFQLEFMANDSSDGTGRGVSSRSTSVGGISETVTYDSSRTTGAVKVAGMMVAPLAVAILSPIRALGRAV